MHALHVRLTSLERGHEVSLRSTRRRGSADRSNPGIAHCITGALRQVGGSRAGRSLELTAREFDLLEYLLRHKGRVVSREMLARDVWKESSRGTPLDNVIDVHISRLRAAIDKGFDRPLLHTVRGAGYVLRDGG